MLKYAKAPRRSGDARATADGRTNHDARCLPAGSGRLRSTAVAAAAVGVRGVGRARPGGAAAVRARAADLRRPARKPGPDPDRPSGAAVEGLADPLGQPRRRLPV